MRNSIEFFLNTHLEWSLSHQDLVITSGTWPETAGIREGRKRGSLFPKINLKY